MQSLFQESCLERKEEKLHPAAPLRWARTDGLPAAGEVVCVPLDIIYLAP